MTEPRAFPNILAVDPTGCGCTECIVGEYVPEEVWCASATASDLAEFITGRVTNNSLTGTFQLVMNGWFSTRSAREFQIRYSERVARELDEINEIVDPDSIVEYC